MPARSMPRPPSRCRLLLAWTGLFTAYTLIFSSLTYFFLMAFHMELLGLSFVFLPLCVLLAWFITRTVRVPILHLTSISCAALFLLFVPRIVVLQLIDRSATSVSGGNYCFFQVGIPNGDRRVRAVLTRHVSDISFFPMLHRRSRVYGPPHVVLITAERTWLWSFWSERFVPWQRIANVNGTPTLEGLQVIGQPSVTQIAECAQMKP